MIARILGTGLALMALVGCSAPKPVVLSCTDQRQVVIDASATDRGKRAVGTIRNTCTRDLVVEYTLTGLDEHSVVVTGPVKLTARVRSNEALPISYALYPDGPAWSMLVVRAAVVGLTPSS